MSMHSSIVEVLNQTGGNVQAAAARLGVSNETVRKVAVALRADPIGRVAETLEAPTDGAIVAPTNGAEKVLAPVPPGGELQRLYIEAIVPQNRQELIDLRTSVLEQLQKQVAGGLITGGVLVGLLKVLVRYDIDLRTLAKPAMALADQAPSQVNIAMLVDKMVQLNPEDLRDFLGAHKAPVVIDAEAGHADPS